MKYCGTNVYGYDATFSALVTYPLLEDTQIKPGLLPTYVYNRPTVFDVTGAATGTTEEFATVDQLKSTWVLDTSELKLRRLYSTLLRVLFFHNFVLISPLLLFSFSNNEYSIHVLFFCLFQKSMRYLVLLRRW